MLPLGLLLFAQDVPPLQKPMAQGLGWIERNGSRASAQSSNASALKARNSDQFTLQGIQPIPFSVVTVLTRVT